jgi:hypothetical protein
MMLVLILQCLFRRRGINSCTYFTHSGLRAPSSPVNLPFLRLSVALTFQHLRFRQGLYLFTSYIYVSQQRLLAETSRATELLFWDHKHSSTLCRQSGKPDGTPNEATSHRALDGWLSFRLHCRPTDRRSAHVANCCLFVDGVIITDWRVNRISCMRIFLNQIPSWENSPHFVRLKSSLPYTQQLPTCPYPQPDGSTPHFHPSPVRFVLTVVSFLQFSHQNFRHCSPSVCPPEL